MKIYFDIGNTNIKYLVNDKTYIIKFSLFNFLCLLLKYHKNKIIILNTNNKFKKIIKFIVSIKRQKMNLIDHQQLNSIVNVNPNINFYDVGLDILISSLYFKNASGLIVINGTGLISVLVQNGVIKNISLSLGDSLKINAINHLIKTNENVNINDIRGISNGSSISLGIFLNIYGIIEYYQKKYHDLNVILTGNNFWNYDLNNFIFNQKQVKYIANLPLKMLKTIF